MAVAGAAFWAGVNAVAPPALPTESHPFQTYVVESGTVGRSIRAPVAATWPTTRTLLADRSGVITTWRHSSGIIVESGDVLVTIDLEPTILAQGAVPTFRGLREGIRGPDVTQFQRLLKAKGFYRGEIDGRFGPQTTAATKRWQKSMLSAQTGAVPLGSLMFVEGLPARVEIIPPVGQRITAGDELFRILGDTPQFVATVTAGQRAELTTGSRILIEGPAGASWQGSLGTFEAMDDGRFQTTIGGVDCGKECDRIPVAAETALSGAIELVPETTGIVVPTSSLVEVPNGSLAVTLDDGTSRPVKVVVEADGFAVVEGLESGSKIRLVSPPDQ